MVDVLKKEYNSFTLVNLIDYWIGQDWSKICYN